MPTMHKRDRLIEVAKSLFYRQGVTQTALAEIAQEARVPLGSVYYHFRTKEALVEAVIQAHVQELHALFMQCEQQSDPRQRLLALLAAERETGPMFVSYGCPYGSLIQELNKEESILASAVTTLFRGYLDWAQTQFRLIGKEEQEARDLAIDLIAALQGAYLLTNCFHSLPLLERKLQRLEAWVRVL